MKKRAQELWIKYRKHTLALVIAIGLVFLMLPASARAEYNFLNSFFSYFWSFAGDWWGNITNAIASVGNLISNGFSGLFTSLQNWLNPVFEFFRSAMQSIVDAVSGVAGRIIETLQNFFNALKTFLVNLFKPILDLIYGIIYFLAQVFNIIKLVIQLVLTLFGVLIAVIGGMFRTLTGLLSFGGGSDYFELHGEFSAMFVYVIELVNSGGFNLIAGIVAVFVWILTARGLVRLISGEVS